MQITANITHSQVSGNPKNPILTKVPRHLLPTSKDYFLGITIQFSHLRCQQKETMAAKISTLRRNLSLDIMQTTFQILSLDAEYP